MAVQCDLILEAWGPLFDAIMEIAPGSRVGKPF